MKDPSNLSPKTHPLEMTSRNSTFFRRAIQRGIFEHRLSLRIKLPFVVIVLTVLSLLTTTILSIQRSRSALINTLQDNLIKQTTLNAEHIRSYLIWTKSMAVDLAAAAEVNDFSKEAILDTIKEALARNEQIFGSTIAYEPYQFDPNLYFWSPYYNRTSNGELKFTQLGNPEYNYFQWAWYLLPKSRNAPILSPPYFDEGGGNIWMVTWSVPFYNKEGGFKGVSTADIPFSDTQEIVQQIVVGKQGYAFLINKQGTVLGIGNNGGVYKTMSDSMLISASSQQAISWNDMIKAMTAGKSGFMEVVDPKDRSMFVAYEPIGLDTGWAIGLAYPKNELLLPATQLQNTLILFAFAILLIFNIILFFFTRSITVPLRTLASRAKLFSKKDIHTVKEQLTEPVNIRTGDELQDLGNAFNKMTIELFQMLDTLEEKVAERTTDLEIARQQSERHVRELQTISEISGIIASEQKIETLLPLITRLVSERFDFYHVGIFLVDETGQWAVLQAANSEGGQRMLMRGHKLEVGATGIVGYVTRNGTPRIALDVGADSAFFNNPDLPATRSEMALPLSVRGQIIGALDVQSIKPGAFTEDDANTLGVLADQIAISIENTRLIGRIQSTLAEVQSLYHQDIATSWAKFVQDEGLVGYRKSLTESKFISQPVVTDEIRQTINRGSVSVFNADRKRTEPILVVPVKLRGQVIGVLNIKATKNEHQWSFDEIGLAEAVSERLALALENARLLQDSQNRAAKEQAISEIVTKISGSVNMRNILQTAVEELGHALPGSEVIIEFEQKNGNVE